jgi:hypothetical protein
MIACSVVVFVLARTYFNYGALLSTESHNSESMRLSWFLGTGSQRLDLAQWASLGHRVAFEYMYPAFAVFAVIGLSYSARQLLKARAEPYLTVSGLVLGAFLTILVFFNVIVIHDYYSIPFIPIYCLLISIGISMIYSTMPQSSLFLRIYFGIFIASIFGSLYYAYTRPLLSYSWNKPLILTGKSIQELVPENAYLFYFHGADYVDPEYLYYARRRGILANIEAAENTMIAKIIKEHGWDANNTYVLANAVRLWPDRQEKFKEKLSNYELREVGTSLDNGIVYKLVSK